jgi:hypothetical protein
VASYGRASLSRFNGSICKTGHYHRQADIRLPPDAGQKNNSFFVSFVKEEQILPFARVLLACTRHRPLAILKPTPPPQHVAGFHAGGTMRPIHWKHGVSGDWSDASDWSNGQVPGAADDVVIHAPGDYTVTIDSDEAAKSLLLDASGATIADNAAFAPGSTFIVEAGTFKIGHGGAVNGGTITVGTAGRLLARQGTLNAAVIDDGTIRAFNGILAIDGAVTGSASAIAAAGATLNFAGGANFSGNISGAGTLLLSDAIWRRLPVRSQPHSCAGFRRHSRAYGRRLNRWQHFWPWFAFHRRRFRPQSDAGGDLSFLAAEHFSRVAHRRRHDR